MEKFWLVSLFNCLKNISDIEYQRSAWLTPSNLVSSYSEMITILYDDNFFEEFIANDFWNSGDKKALDLHSKLVLLNDLIENYEKLESDEAIINDPKWLKIVNQAKEVVEFWIVMGFPVT